MHHIISLKGQPSCNLSLLFYFAYLPVLPVFPGCHRTCTDTLSDFPPPQRGSSPLLERCTRKGIFRITPSALTDTGYVLLVPASFGSWSKIQVITLVLACVLSLQHLVTECHFFVEVSSVDCPLTGMGGIEPPIKESKSFALPLGYIPI